MCCFGNTSGEVTEVSSRTTLCSLNGNNISAAAVKNALKADVSAITFIKHQGWLVKEPVVFKC